MSHAQLAFVGRLVRHAVGVILLCLTRAARAAVVAGVAGVVVTEIVAAVLTHRFPAEGAAHLVALALGVVLAYAAGMTVLAAELITGVIDAVRLLEGDATAGVRAAAVGVEREAGALVPGLFRWASLGSAIGLLRARSIQDPRPAAVHGPGVAPGQWSPRASDAPVARQLAHRQLGQRPGDDPTDETLAALAPTVPTGAPPDAPSEVPTADVLPSAPLGQPVPADRLPRIEWIDEPPSAPRDAEPASQVNRRPAPSSPITRPLPQEAPTSPLADEPTPTPAARGTDAKPSSASSEAPAPAAGLAEPQIWHADESLQPTLANWHDPSRGSEDEPDEDAGIRPVDAFGGPPPGAVTRPLSHDTQPLSTNTRPLARDERPPTPRGSVWDHISQVLAGRPLESLPPEDGDEPASDVQPPSDDGPAG